MLPSVCLGALLTSAGRAGPADLYCCCDVPCKGAAC